MKTLKIHYLQHVPFEGLGYIENWISENNHQISCTKFFENEDLPNPDHFDWLIVMGGPMSVNDYEKHPWLKLEKKLIRNAIEKGKTVIGICLGAQLIASVLGAKVYPGLKKEIGWYPVHKTKAGLDHSLLSDLPETFTAFHWHGDTFDLPKDSVHLLQTEVCPNQAFLYNERVLGLQFHFEVTPKSISQITSNCKNELTPDEFIQSEEEILLMNGESKRLNSYLSNILTKLEKG